MGRAKIETMAWLLGEAFEGDPAQSLVANLQEVDDEQFLALPPGGGRSIGDILEHLAWAKWMYDDYAFGQGTRRGDQPPMVTEDGRPRPRAELMSWLREGHTRLVRSIAGLQHDDELERPRPSNWGEMLPTRTLIRIMIAHDYYHAGEINHIRALMQKSDRWRY